ncbi:MAG: hypothetical protein CSB13_04065 [Chloroflexi bacterium]|nr:MAG: hypothetical protein CSB13_04065 [Chloroflexota bacterium]
MAKRVKQRSKTTKKAERSTNWILIGGIIGVGVIALLGLLFFSLQGPGAPTPVPTPTRSLLLQNHCENNPENCIIKGSEEAPVTIIEVSDYGCGHCRKFNLDSAPTIKEQYVDTGVLRWITLPYALTGQTGLPTAPSANAALCAAEQGAFDEFHKALFEMQGTSNFNNMNGFIETANSLNLDSDALVSCVENGRYQDLILDNIQAANQAGVNSTPSFFVNGKLVKGNMPLSTFQNLIESEAGS